MRNIVQIKLLVPCLLACLVPCVGASSASAAEPWWHLNSSSALANVSPGPCGGVGQQECGQIVVTAADTGDADANGGGVPIKITDTLPPRLVATAIGAREVEGGYNNGVGGASCSLAELSCEYTGNLSDYEQIQVLISVEVQPGAESEEEVNHASVSGGGALSTSVSRPVTVSAAAPPFGVENYEITPEEEGGAPDKRAGSHPFQLSTTLTLNQTSEPERPPALPKDLDFKLPPGLVGNPTVFPQCSEQDFLQRPEEGDVVNDCPADTALGVAALTINIPNIGKNSVSSLVVPLFNVVPKVGEPARFGFYYDLIPVYLDTSVRTGGNYGVTVSVDNITQISNFISSRVTFWGVPGDPRHNNARGWSCIDDEGLVAEEGLPPCTDGVEQHPAPFLVLPTSCTGPLSTEVEADSWKEVGAFQSFAQNPLGLLPALDGCNRLPFEPSIGVAPDVRSASSPSGLAVHINVPQSVDLDSEGLSASDVKDTTVALPAGLAINPSSSDGLQACSLLTGKEPGKESQEGKGEVSGINLETKQPANCPDASKVATVEIHSPLLPNPLKGFVYLAEQEANPFGSVFAMYLVAYDPVSGTLVKLAGKIEPNPVTGQLVSTFENTPQLPFDELELHFFGGERAPLATPAHCGRYETTTSILPWSENPAAEPTSSFEILTGPNGSACPGQGLPFNPSSTGGALNLQAGAFSPFTTTLSRNNGEQNLSSAEVKLPPGLSGILSTVPLCREPQANEGTCSAASQIGETTVSVGVGGEPYTVTGGKVYITGPYNGTSECTTPGTNGCAPFGLAVATPAKAGPYDLANTKNNHPACDCVLVRAKIEINPSTAALTVTSNPAGSAGSIPTIIEGIPLEIQHVNITTTRPAFQFNPTSCNKMAVEATLHSAEGATSNISIPFQVTNCATLKFEPKFSVSTSGKTSKANGASLTTKVSYPKVPQGSDADIGYVKVELPKALPSRLTTLQKACTQAQFKANPAGCPAASVIGTAVVHTQLLPVPLTGPAYFVSNGGEAFPQLIMVLQGYGIEIELVGDTFISKSGITSTTFHTVPDQPFESFELDLHNGPYSALAANGNLCAEASKLVMPTEFIGQNGAEVHQSTKIGVSGCKQEIRVLSHKVKGKTATIVVSVPAAGKLTATGKGVSKGSGKSSKAQNVTVKVSLSKREQAFLARHHRKQEKVEVKLAFSPKKGAKLSTSVTVSVG
jgi:hypothetical protein